ncbi:MAG: rhomboid family intramembrane serine protease [Acidobacteriota bacterium]
MTVDLIILNSIIFLYQLVLGPHGMEQFFAGYSVIPRDITSASGYLAGYIPLITSMFLHGGWMHLIGNMWFLWLFGDNVEDLMGPIRFFFFYIICGVIAALVHVFVYPLSNVPTVGASGAIAGVMGAYFLMYPRAQVVTLVPIFLFWFVEIPAWVFLGLWFLIQFFQGTATMASGTAQIAFWAHIGGFIAGMLIYRVFKTREEIRPDYW